MRAESPKSEIPRVTEGLFFTTPPPLPRGPHQLTTDEVVANHRERVMIAFTELVAARGFHDVGVAEIVARSGVSRTAFYRCFENRDACADAAYARFIEVLVQQMTTRITRTRVSRDIPLIVRAYLDCLSADLVTARTFQLEFDARGATARRRRREALTFVADALRAEHTALAKTDPTLDPDLAPEVFLAAVYAVRQVASDWLDADRFDPDGFDADRFDPDQFDADGHVDLAELEPLLSGWLTRGLQRS